MKPSSMDKWISRRNARRLMEFGVHPAANKKEPGISIMNHYTLYNSSMAKAMVRDNIECLKIMRARKFKNEKS